ncbi:MAG: ABC transporter permease [Halothermotrichaceae bacterium]
MLFKILKKDFMRKKIITIAVFIFIMLLAILMASGTNMLIDLSNSLEHLLEETSAPHFVQYHAGKLNKADINQWSHDNPYVKKQQTSAMINIDGSKVYLNNKDRSENGSVIDMGFVKQNKSFDYLLNLNNEIIKVNEGEIAVPIYYMQNRNLSIGDTLTIKDKGQSLTFTITDFVRDIQMNSSIVYSKRFVVSNIDYEKIKVITGDIEYLIAFQLYDLADLNKFSNQYSNSGLPNKGPTIDYDILIIVNSITDGLIAAVIILISLLLNMIALLCLRFVILLTMEEDYKEIGMMKAIGISLKDIKKIYIVKYIMLSFTAVVTGYFISIFLNNIFSSNIMLYIGQAPKSIIETIIPFLSVLLIAVVVIIFCMIILRRFNNISAVEAIRLGSSGHKYAVREKLALYKSKFFNPAIFLGIRDVFLRFRLYILLFLVFILCTFIVIVPINFLNTIQSSDIVKYMGMGKSDIIMDLRQSEQIRQRFNEMIDFVKNDPDVERYESFVTSQYQIINPEGIKESIYLETGDFSIFPLDYIEGVSPMLSNEIALSYLSADELKKKVGDEVKLIIRGKPHSMIVTGIYQDITNGGRTAKANIKPNHETAVWYNINLDVRNDVSAKVEEYKQKFDNVQITDLVGCFQQTFANTIDQLNLLTVTAIIVAVLVMILIISLFSKMLTARDMTQIAIKRSLGISLQKIKIEYISRALLVLNLGIVVGTILSNTLGQYLLGVVLSFFGAPDMVFTINPLESYILTPIIMIAIVTITSLLSMKSIKEYSVADINAE